MDHIKKLHKSVVKEIEKVEYDPARQPTPEKEQGTPDSTISAQPRNEDFNWCPSSLSWDEMVAEEQELAETSEDTEATYNIES